MKVKDKKRILSPWVKKGSLKKTFRTNKKITFRGVSTSGPKEKYFYHRKRKIS